MANILEQKDVYPLFQLATVGMLQLSDSMAFSSMYPSVYFMMKYFDIADDDSHIAIYSGYLGAAFLLGEYMSSSFWVKASNKYGRKTTLLCGCASRAFCLIIFGLSTNFYMALLARFLMGSCGGKSDVYRNTVEEIAHEDRHKDRALKSISRDWTFGKVFGYYLGGQFSHPNIYKPATQNDGSLLSKYPFLVSNLAVFCCIATDIILVWLFLEETHEQRKYVRDIGLEKGDIIRRSLGFQVPERPWKSRKKDSKADILPLANMEVSAKHNFPYQIANVQVNIFEESSNIQTDIESYEVDELVITSASCSCIINDFMFCFQNIFYFEFFPLLLASPLRAEDLKFPFHIKGGFSYNAYGIGIFTFITGNIGSLLQIPLSIISIYCGRKRTAEITLFIYPITYFLLPLYLSTMQQYNKEISESVNGILLFVNMVVLWSVEFFTSPDHQTYSDISSSKEQRQRAYSIRFVTLAKCVAPIIGGWMISKFDAQGYGGIPWWILSAWSTITLLHSIYINRKNVA